MTFAGFVVICSVVGVFASLLSELASAIPLHGAGPDQYVTRFLSKSFGFALGWNYWYAYAILVPFEITVATLVIGYWSPPVNDAVWISILFVVIIGLNYLPITGSGEAEFAFSSLKLAMLIGIMLASIVITAGGGPTGEAVGVQYWDPPANSWIVDGATGKFVAFLGVLIACVLPVSFCLSSLLPLS